MKKLFIVAAIAVFGFTTLNAQDTNFGVKAGADFASAKVEFDGVSATASETGFYVGAFAQIGLSEEFAIQPEALYVSIDGEGSIHVPVLANYSVSEQFDLLVGPAFDILLDTGEGFSSFNYGIEAGAAYNITEEFLVEARYNIGLANLIEDAPSGFSSKLSGLYVGLGYRF